MTTLRMYDLPASPFCIKVRALLDYKGLAFERIYFTGPALLVLRRRGKIGKVPALEIDGTLICDSTNIAYELERLSPEPPILPADPRERALCHVIEDWADESLYWIGIYYRWVDPEGRASAASVFPKGFMGQLVIPRIVRRKATQQVMGQGVGRKPPKDVAADLDRQLLHLSSLLQPGPFLLGDRPMLCDFAVTGQLVYLARTPHGKRALEQYSSINDFMARMRELRKNEPQRGEKIPTR